MSRKGCSARNQSNGVAPCFAQTDQTGLYLEQFITQKLLWSIVREETVKTLPAEVVVFVLTAAVVVEVLVVQLAAADAKVFVAAVVAVVSIAAPDIPEKTAKNTKGTKTVNTTSKHLALSVYISTFSFTSKIF